MDLKALEFADVLSRIQRHSKTQAGQIRIQSLEPFSQAQKALTSMAEITSAKAYILHAKAPIFGDFFDIEPILHDMKIARVLSIQDLMRLRVFLKHLNAVTVTLKNPPDDMDIAALLPYIESLYTLKEIRLSIDHIVDDNGLKEDASKTLKSLLKERTVLENRLTEKLKAIVDQSATLLSESFYTERQGRYVVPVKQTYKNRFKGSVVDYSSSGETIYMEPHVVAEMSAHKRAMDAAIEKEIETILTSISQTLFDAYETFKNNHRVITQLDEIFAKATYAVECDMQGVTFTSELKLNEARHPLIDPTEVVANTIHLASNQRMVIISGSNTGGKTVVLKTVGLLALMAQSGLLISVGRQSTVPFYSGIYADIGDEQSIEQSLSTFSSHLTHINHIIEHATPRSLILLDEIGGGTDPKAGASLARALLDYFSGEAFDVFVTTHYPELKAYAYDHDYAVNASVAFDKTTLQPTYHLYMDTPGESHAFLIAKRLGMKPSLIAASENYYQNEQNPVSDLIETLEKKRVELEKEKRKAESVNAALKEKEATLNATLIEAQEKKESLEEKYQRALRLERDQLQAQFAETLQALKDKAALKPHDITKAKEILFKSPNVAKKTKDSHIYQAKDRVLIHKYNRQGDLLKKLSKDTWSVQMGNVETTLKEADFSFVEGAKKPPLKKTPPAPRLQKKVPAECDLRGLRVEEAKHTLEKYLDDCIVAKMPFARIIHGYGTLAVRTMVHETLKKSSFIASYRDGTGNEGGSGVTVINF